MDDNTARRTDTIDAYFRQQADKDARIAELEAELASLERISVGNLKALQERNQGLQRRVFQLERQCNSLREFIGDFGAPLE